MADDIEEVEVTAPRADESFDNFMDSIVTTSMTHALDPVWTNSFLSGVTDSVSRVAPSGVVNLADSSSANLTGLMGGNAALARTGNDGPSLAERAFQKVKDFGDWTEGHKVLTNLVAMGIANMVGGDARRAQADALRARGEADRSNAATLAEAQRFKESQAASGSGVTLPTGLINSQFVNLKKKNPPALNTQKVI